MNSDQKNKLQEELQYSATRSQGPGGQHVNKVNTRIELRFDIFNSKTLTDRDKDRLFKALANRITADNQLLIVEQGSRSQLRNKEEATRRFLRLVEQALKPVKKRYRTKPTRASVQRRLESKRRHSSKKSLRSNKNLGAD